MSATTSIHPNFVSNQLLTSTQLNQLFEYLDAQDRLSRLKLTGNGIICGLGWQHMADNSIHINEGYGISSDGYLVSINSNTYTRYREYTDPDVDDADAETPSPLYLAWKNSGSIKGQVDGILELETVEKEDNHELTATELANSILVIYLERKTVDLTSCLVTDCDNKGSNIHFTPRVLLVPEAVLDAVDTCPDAPQALRVPRLHTEVNLEDVNFTIDINQAYYNISAGFKTPLITAINNALNAYAVFVDLDDDWSWLELLKNWYEQVNDGTETNQYFYEITKILVRAYNELNQAACRLFTDCHAELDFPRHLMLGHLDDEENYRHEFSASPVQNVARGDLKTVRLLFERIRALIQELPSHELLTNSEGVPAEIRVLPSNTESSPLGETAIPWYYANSDPVKKRWQPASCCTTIPAWSYSADKDIDSDYNRASLIRIDGHIGLSCEEAVTKLESVKSRHNTEFCVLPLNLNDNRNKQLVELNNNIIDKEHELFISRREYRIAFIEAMKDGEISEEELKNLRKLTAAIQGLTEEQLKTYKEWSALRCQIKLLCHPVELEADYRNFRCQYIGMLAEVKSSLLDNPAFLPEKMKEIGGLDKGTIEPSEYILIRLSEIYSDLSNLLNLLPLRLCEFNYSLFHSRSQSFISDLVEYQFILPLSIADFSKKDKKISEEVIIKRTVESIAQLEDNFQRQVNVYQRFINNNLSACMATVYFHYETMRRLNSAWFKRFARINRGMEVVFGVEKGGSFILLCDDDERVVADMALSDCASCCCEVTTDIVCLPPVAKPDFISVTLKEDDKPERLSYKPVDLVIDVLKNDYSQMDAESIDLNLELDLSESELGGQITKKDGKVEYKHDEPFPGLVDRFSYILREESKACDDRVIGHVSIFFAPPLTVETGNITGETRGVKDGDDFGPIEGATIKIIETGASIISKINDDKIAYFEFLNLPYSTYTVVATHPEGFVSEPVSVIVDKASVPVTLLLSPEKITDTEEEIRRGEILGTTLYRGEQLSNAVVTIRETGQTTTSSSEIEKGVFKFMDLLYATYTLVATHEKGMKSKPLTVTVDKETQSIVLELLDPVVIDVEAGHWVATDETWIARVADSTGSDSVKAKDKLINVLSDRRKEELVVLTRADSNESVKSSEAFTSASIFINDSVSSPTASPDSVRAEYSDLSRHLLAAIEKGTAEEKAIYQDLLKSASVSYMDRLYFSGDESVSETTAKELTVIAKTIDKSGLDINAVTEEWGGKLRDELKLSSAEEMMSALR